ncbi:putative rpn2_yeast 26S proteasome regulatory subunit rpn2 [Babesia bovis T2Bo]|uniref:putative rpn2_yeast 26S proteasome regulatory subunit rpn2 n=1 Tax=Babesia bovis T2Bo TaxID=484906 RepID=UPI001C36D07E|nr:putative rpn2_yeast 26S proteasome regulatory subunit rpn2 [Babesia bovis T2Bo]EDO06119.2 putative rpn2_yeast 26S proteasome regulatory subunit rpn2 [Babesia bovis T2Bo]
MLVAQPPDKCSALADAYNGHEPMDRISSADPVIALLSERDDASRELGLRQLNILVDTFWAEIADSLELIHQLHNDTSFSTRNLAALVLSKVYFHLSNYPKALQYALAAGEHFNLQESSEYVNIIVANAIDEYIRDRQAVVDGENSAISNGVVCGFQQQLESLVTKLITMSVASGDEQHAIGIALDSRRLDFVCEILRNSTSSGPLIDYTIGLLENVISRDFCLQLYREIRDILVSMSQDTLINHYQSLVTCLYRLDDANAMAQLLHDIIIRDEHLRAYQICYDLVDIGDQKFLNGMKASVALSVPDDIRFDRVKHILSGDSTTELYLQFLHRKNHTDLRLLEHYMTSIDQRSSICHSAVVMAHAIMQAGTCCDLFLRDNIGWLAKANHWAKFTATASIGVVHKGYVKNCKKVLSAYLPGSSPNSSQAFSEGGSLYAIGLIMANHYDSEAVDILTQHIKNESVEEAVHHGAALGLGLVCMGQCDRAVYEELNNILLKNNAVSGQAAAIGIGLLMFGSGNLEVLDALHSCCVDTQHEKISRACALAIAMVLYRLEKDADSMIAKMTKDNDPVVRYGGMFAYAMAYCGTGSSKVVKALLYASVSDVSDDVRRAAVISLGFVLCNTPEEVPKVLKLLVASYNPHVRYAAAIALGITCAASPQPDVLRLLHALSSDSADFVRQGAFIALGLVLQQSNADTSNDVMQVRELFKNIAGEKHQEVMAKFGAILGAGLMDAGGQNCVASLYTCRGNMRLEAVAGFLMFSQYWFWHPFMHFISLALQPTCLIGINGDLQIPTGYKVLCTAPPKLFEYVHHMTDEPVESNKGEVTAVLSISAKRHAWMASGKSVEHVEDSGGNINGKPIMPDDSVSVNSDGRSQRLEVASIAATLGHSSVASRDGSSVDYNNDVVMTSDGISVSSNNEFLNAAVLDEMGEANVDHLMSGATLLQNPCRLLPRQAMYVVTPKDSRYQPVFTDRSYGIVLLRDTTPDEPEEYVACGTDQPEAQPFTPFIYKRQQ